MRTASEAWQHEQFRRAMYYGGLSVRDALGPVKQVPVECDVDDGWEDERFGEPDPYPDLADLKEYAE